jgi:hypothetical protein
LKILTTDKLNILVPKNIGAQKVRSAKMKKVQLFRNFLWFPIISITLFNVTFKIEDKNYQIPQSHYIILAILVFLFLLSFLFNKNS